jgi:hypothetical protein
MYSPMDAAPRFEPSAAPTSSTANVCPVNGTGVNGRAIFTCASAATNKAPSTINVTSRSQLAARGNVRV